MDDNLTIPQREAVEHGDGPMLILAGPGSGKTRVVTHRIARLLERGIPAGNILALTFTNKAADEMKGRVAALAPGQRVWISTFHRFCARLLREYASLVGLEENFTIYDAGDSQRALQHALHGLEDLNLTQVSPEQIAREISNCKNELVTADCYQPRNSGHVASILVDAYPAYQRQLIRSNAVDFDDLLLHAVMLLTGNPELRAALDEQYRFVMVDEYQDTNVAQYTIVRALSIDYPNLAVTGDPDQAIYCWRGATLQNILDFEKDYQHVRIVKLEQNYRSTPEILRVADQLIGHNERRKKKSLFTENAAGEAVRLNVFPTHFDEAQGIARDIAQLVAAGQHAYSDFAIFYRMNALSRYLEYALHRQGIPYQIVNGVEFFQRREVKDVMGYLQLINNPRDDMAFLRTINTPARGLGRVTLDRIASFARDQRLPLLDAARVARSIPKMQKRAVARLDEFVQLMDDCMQMATAPVREILQYVLLRSGYEEFVRDTDERADEDRSANVAELLNAAQHFDDLNEGVGNLEGFLEQASLVSDTDAWEEESGKVTLMTLHAAKGLEFKAVYIVAVEQGRLPHERSRQDVEQLEEERRLFFVGITRARQRLTLSYAKYRDVRGTQTPTVPSAFLMELPREELQITQPSSSAAYPDSWDFDGGADDYSDAEDDDPVLHPDDQPAAMPSHSPAGISLGSPTPRNGSSARTKHSTEPKLSLRSLPTAAELDAAGRDGATPLAQRLPATSTSASLPESIQPGLRVTHPEYGLGKIAKVSGVGKNCTVTVNFVTAGPKTFVLGKSPLVFLG